LISKNCKASAALFIFPDIQLVNQTSRPTFWCATCDLDAVHLVKPRFANCAIHFANFASVIDNVHVRKIVCFRLKCLCKSLSEKRSDPLRRGKCSNCGLDKMFTKTELDCAIALVHRSMPPTPQYAWPLLRRRLGIDVIVKHENHTPTGAFKVRGGIVYLDRLLATKPTVSGIITATRGNHGQSIALAAAQVGLPVTVVVPLGNSQEKNAAMRAFGAEVIESGDDFDAARLRLPELATALGYEVVPSFHRDLVTGVATYAYELFSAFSDLDAVYVPIGLGSGICGMIGVRNLMGLKTEIIGVVSENANAYYRSYLAGYPISTESADTFADGIAVRQVDSDALAMIIQGVSRIVEVSDQQIAEAIGVLHEDTHNMAEGAGAAALAGLVKEQWRYRGKRCGVILCGGNIDRALAAECLAGGVPVMKRSAIAKL